MRNETKGKKKRSGKLVGGGMRRKRRRSRNRKGEFVPKVGVSPLSNRVCAFWEGVQTHLMSCKLV